MSMLHLNVLSAVPLHNLFSYRAIHFLKKGYKIRNNYKELLRSFQAQHKGGHILLDYLKPDLNELHSIFKGYQALI